MPNQLPAFLTLTKQLLVIMNSDPCLDDLPPHTEIVYKELSKNAPMTQKDLIEATNLPFRPVRDALEELKACDSVEELVYSHGRLRLYLFERDSSGTEDREAATAV